MDLDIMIIIIAKFDTELDYNFFCRTANYNFTITTEVQ